MIYIVITDHEEISCWDELWSRLQARNRQDNDFQLITRRHSRAEQSTIDGKFKFL